MTCGLDRLPDRYSNRLRRSVDKVKEEVEEIGTRVTTLEGSSSGVTVYSIDLTANDSVSLADPSAEGEIVVFGIASNDATWGYTINFNTNAVVDIVDTTASATTDGSGEAGSYIVLLGMDYGGTLRWWIMKMYNFSVPPP